MDIDPLVERLLSEAVALRRQLHKIPETGYKERKTQAFIRDYLEKHRPDSLERVADTGIKAVYYSPGATQTIALRSDIDGLAMQEQNDGLDFRSIHPGCMHACGHDGHMTMLLLAAKLISTHREQLGCNVVLLFQPAEESIGGAKRMIDEGVLRNPDVDRIFGMHVWPDVPFGKIGLREGPMMAQTNQFDISILGKSAHGAAPHNGIDAIVTAAELVLMLQTIISRSIDPMKKALITIGKIEGGQTRNIIAENVVMSGTIRTFDYTTCSVVIDRIHEILEGLSLATGVSASFKEIMRYPVLENPAQLCDFIASLVDFRDLEVVDEVMAAEDFSFYQQQIPGLFMFVGIGGETCKYPLHSSHFNFDERALLYGVEVYRRILGIEG